MKLRTVPLEKDVTQDPVVLREYEPIIALRDQCGEKEVLRQIVQVTGEPGKVRRLGGGSRAIREIGLHGVAGAGRYELAHQ